ncbi:Imm10 family immunity protein [Actinoplanes rectilineatus]|uniref:Imm10 family immunity protein n=1 Tax=Actinoplanes rectilineatus TaxID=113571 RepID=UPI0005F2B3F8|nr:Imm10 family immunity protein [Actinoplanes rectilineatus]
MALYDPGPDGPRGFEFQRDLRDHDDPAAWQPPVYCVVTGDHDVHYGGILAVTWQASRCTMLFTEQAAAALNLPGTELILQLRLTEEQSVTARAGLERVLSFGAPDLIPALTGFD